MKKLLFVLVLLVGCNPSYVVPDGQESKYYYSMEQCDKEHNMALGKWAFGALYYQAIKEEYDKCMADKGFPVDTR
jgi:hypothetical protein